MKRASGVAVTLLTLVFATPAVSEVQFRTSSGNIVCAMGSVGARTKGASPNSTPNSSRTLR
jgi:hypothetical protein